MKRKDKFEEIKKQIEAFKSDATTTHLKEDDNSATIIVNIEENPYQAFSGNNMLSNDLYEFIENTFILIDNKKKNIKLKLIFNDTFNDEEKKHIISLINMHYALLYKETKRLIKRTKIIAWILLFIGSIIMGLYGFLCYRNINFIFRETIGIFSWVFLWESCDEFFFTNNSNRIKMLQCLILWESEKIIQP